MCQKHKAKGVKSFWACTPALLVAWSPTRLAAFSFRAANPSKRSCSEAAAHFTRLAGVL